MQTPHALRATLLCALVGLSLAGCGGGGGGAPVPAPPPPPPPPPTSATVGITPATASDWWGYDIALSATVRDGAGNPVSPPPALSWTSSADSVATVNGSGVVSLLRLGSATIRAAATGATQGTATITVRGFAALATADQDTSCVLSDDRLQVLCWGDNGPSNEPRIPNPRNLSDYPQATPITRGTIPAGARIRQATMSTFHGCALTEAGQAHCWGDGARGALGNGATADVTAPVAVVAGQIPAGVTLTSIAAAPTRTCATGSDGNVYCWGTGDLPVSGLPTNTPQPSPLRAERGQIPAGVRITAVDHSTNGGYMLGDDGRVYAWGPSPLPAPLPQGQIPTNVRIVQISADDGFGCGVGDDGRAYCWGTGQGRRFGDGSTAFRSGAAPVQVAQGAVPAGVRLTALTVGSLSSSNCATGDDGNAYCWGVGFQRSLGNGVLTDDVALTPVPVLDGGRPAGVRFTQVVCAQFHCVALGDDGRGYSWGSNMGQVGGRAGGAAAQPTLMTRPNRD